VSGADLPVLEDGETVDLVVLSAVHQARQHCGPIAHLTARAYAKSMGGTQRQMDEAEHRVRAATGVTG
jgi:hypothetical protein